MSTVTLLATSLFATFSALVFLFVGISVHRRPVARENEDVMRAFAWWWYGLAAITFHTAIVNSLAAAGYVNFHLMLTLLYALILLLCVALWGLAYYLIYLFTGRREWKVLLAILYAGYYLITMYLIVAANPLRVAVGDWGTTFVYERSFANTPVSRVLGLLLLGPQIVGAIAYLIVGWKAPDPFVRYRVALVCGAILVWFGTSLAASALGFNEISWWPIATRLISLGAALIVLAAYRPPRWVREALGRPRSAGTSPG